jgi:hypothetical protein
MAKINLEGGTVKVFCLHYIVNKVEYHTGGGDQWETQNRVHTHLGPGSHNKRGYTPILDEIGLMKLKCNMEISGDGVSVILDNS